MFALFLYLITLASVLEILEDELKKQKQADKPTTPNPVKWLKRFCLQHKLRVSYNVTDELRAFNSEEEELLEFFEVCAKIGSVEATGGSHSFNAARKVAAHALKTKILAYGDFWEEEINKPEDYDSTFEKDYTFVRELGSGGYGKVLEVLNKTTKKSMAIKRLELPSKERKKQQIIRGEIECFPVLAHKNVIRFYRGWFENPPIGWQTRFDLLHGIIDFEELDNTFSDDSDSSDDESDVGQQNATIQTVVSYLYIEMELCKNGTLEKWLQNNLDDRSLALTFFKQLLEGVAYLHENEIVHR